MNLFDLFVPGINLGGSIHRGPIPKSVIRWILSLYLYNYMVTSAIIETQLFVKMSMSSL